MQDDNNAFEPPIDGILDLHTFNPRDVKELIPEYISACRAKGIYRLRIIHGKGTGTLRQVVHSILSKHPAVSSYRLDSETPGSWGATLVELKKD